MLFSGQFCWPHCETEQPPGSFQEQHFIEPLKHQDVRLTLELKCSLDKLTVYLARLSRLSEMYCKALLKHPTDPGIYSSEQIHNVTTEADSGRTTKCAVS